MPAGEFKAQCFAVRDEIRKTGEPVLITKRGKAGGQTGSRRPSAAEDIFGYMAGKVKIVDDIIGPITPSEDWDSKGSCTIFMSSWL